ncbi:MAG: histidine phosphatase family protein [Flavitalea sp.]
MKTLLLVRHAKSSWENFNVTDKERPLNERGIQNALEMARRLCDKKISIDAFLSSPAKRARSTAEFFASTFQVSAGKIIIVPELYIASMEAILQAIQNAPEYASSIAVFSHNTGITDFANVLTSTHIDHMPTCAIFAVNCPISHWKEFRTEKNEFFFFDYPKSQ